MQQITINFDQRWVDSYATCREFVAYRVHNQGKPQKHIAADLDMSPSQLTQKLAGGNGSKNKARLTLDDLEQFIDRTGDTSPIQYLAEKYLAPKDEIETLRRKLAIAEHRERTANQEGGKTGSSLSAVDSNDGRRS